MHAWQHRWTYQKTTKNITYWSYCIVTMLALNILNTKASVLCLSHSPHFIQTTYIVSALLHFPVFYRHLVICFFSLYNTTFCSKCMYRMNTNDLNGFKYSFNKSKRNNLIQLTPLEGSELKTCPGTFVDFNLRSEVDSIHIKAITGFLPDTWHVNSCALVAFVGVTLLLPCAVKSFRFSFQLSQYNFFMPFRFVD